MGTGLSSAKEVVETGKTANSSASADSIFIAIANAWNDVDEQTLADLVHPDGVRINTGGKGDRLTRYSPSQAYYFFKNLFQKRQTLKFSFVRVQENDDHDRTHALAVWKWQSEGKDREDRFVFVLRFKQDRWLLSEINSIK